VAQHHRESGGYWLVMVGFVVVWDVRVLACKGECKGATWYLD